MNIKLEEQIWLMLALLFVLLLIKTENSSEDFQDLYT